MKNTQKGFALIPLVIVLALFVIGGGVYVYVQKKQVNPLVAENMALLQATSTAQNSSSKSFDFVSVPGMSKYTDADFGFSFWYPSGWKMDEAPNTNFTIAYIGGVVKKRWELYSTIDGDHSMKIEEYYSPSASITLNAESGCPGGHCSTTYRYYFDTNAHTWMQEYPLGEGSERGDSYTVVPGTTKPADVSHNTMGGLHIFSGGFRGETMVVPLSAHNFVAVTDNPWIVGVFKPYLVKTVTALDSSVATPLNVTQQQIIIQTEKDAYQQEADRMKALRTFSITSVASSGLPSGQIYSGEKFIVSGPQIRGCEMVRPQSCNVDVWVGDKLGTFVSDPSQLTFIAPQLPPGTYNLYIMYPTTGAESQIVQVKVLSR